MARKRCKSGCPHPDAAEYLAGLPDEEAAAHPPLVRKRDDGGSVQYWREGGEVLWSDADLGGERRPGALRALLESAARNFEGLLPKLAAEAAGPSPDLDSVETAFRDGLHDSGATALKAFLEEVDRELPTPNCESCGKAMQRHQLKVKRFTTRLGSVEVERTYCLCRDCGGGHFPLDRALGIEGESHTPGAASIIADAVVDSSYEAAGRKLVNLAGVSIPTSTLQRRARKIGEQLQRFEREAVEAGDPPAARAYLSIDGTGVPVRREEAEGVRGKGEDGVAKTREAKVFVVHSAEERHPETGEPEKDAGSETWSGLIDSAAAAGGVSRNSDFAARLEREAARTGLRKAEELVVISDGASWILNVCQELFAGQNVTFILDFWHATEYLSDALKALCPDKAKRKEQLKKLKSRLKSGGAISIVGELAPHRERGEAVAKCIDYFEKNKERMRYDSYRERRMQIGSGIVESSCRHIVGLRLKRPGSRWTLKGANAMLAIKCAIANMRWVDFMDWKVKMSRAA